MSLRTVVSVSLTMTLTLLLAACGDKEPDPASEGGASAKPNLIEEDVLYEHDGVQLEGYLAYDAARKGKRPGVLVIHEWWGLTDHPKERARRLAKMGYVAFCLDMYGKGKVTDDPQQAGEWSGAFKNDRTGFGRARLKAGYDVLAEDERVDAAKIGVMGFCYGGTVALEAAWAGLGVKGVVSFHGSLTTPVEGDDVEAAVLVCNGAADVWVTQASIQALQDAMTDRGVRYDIESYEGAVHAFTNPGADARGMDNVKYHKAADEKSWAAMTAFWKTHLGE